jgi:hypothetical protein
MGSHTKFKTWTSYDGPDKTYKYKLYDADMNLLEGALNDLVKEELGEVGYLPWRCSSLHLPGWPGRSFYRATDVFYKLTEIAMHKMG